MKILSLETATYFGGIAFISETARESAGPFSARAASKEILVAINDLLHKHNCSPGELDLIAVSTGPGLFTGVRVGLSIAKTLAWAQGAQGRTGLVGVPTLEAVAMSAIQDADMTDGDIVIPVIDARRGEVYAAAFELTNCGLLPLGEDLVIRPERLREKLLGNKEMEAKHLYLAGDALEKYPAEISEQFPNGRTLDYQQGNLAIAVAELGRHRFSAGGGMHPEELQPHYVRRPDARPSVQL